MSLNDFRSFFPIFQKHPNLVYFDTAATTLKPQVMITALNDFYQNNGLSLKLSGFLSAQNDQLMIQARQQTACFLNVQENEIIFTAGATEGLNLIAQSVVEMISPGDEIITSALEHNSSLLPWMQLTHQKKAHLVFVPLDEQRRITLVNLQRVFTKKTKVVALTHISNVLGCETPIKAITHWVRQQNNEVLVILDAAQSVGHVILDLFDLDVDFMVFSTHKVYGPFGLGVLFGKIKWLQRITPALLGGSSVKAVNQHQFWLRDLPWKWSAGTPNISGIFAWYKVLEWLQQIGLAQIQDYEKKIMMQIYAELQQIPHVILFNDNTTTNIINFNLRGIHAHDVANFFAQNHVYVRAGQHCAHLALQVIDQISTIRISVGIHNNQADINTLIASLHQVQTFFHSDEN